MKASTPISSLLISLNWIPVLVDGVKYPWHRKPQKYARNRELINGPRIYRWVLRSKVGDIESVYIGQSEKFEKRLTRYRRLRESGTEVYVNNAFSDCEEHGGTVELQFLEVAEFEINGTLVDTSARSLGNHVVRQLLETTAILTAQSEPPNLLNRPSKNVQLKDALKFATRGPYARKMLLDQLTKVSS
jgi:hypothetical protein